MTNTLGFAIQLARQTGELLLEHFHSKTIQLQLKSDNTAVTQADLAADRLISNAIQKAYPRDLLVSEELQSTLPNSPGEHTPGTWIIDPLDGTTNFSLGLQIWGVSIAPPGEWLAAHSRALFPCNRRNVPCPKPGRGFLERGSYPGGGFRFE